LLTGRHPLELGLVSNLSALPDGVPTLASALRERGWQTAAVVSNYVLRGKTGLAVGFDHFDDTMQQREAVRGWPERTATDTTDAALRACAALVEAADAGWLPSPDSIKRFIHRFFKHRNELSAAPLWRDN
jgi:arylsulfatase A-like enzyme